jgi:hypothetical protein
MNVSDLVKDKCYKANLLRYCFATVQKLVVRDGCYALANEREKVIYPLEFVLLDKEAQGEWWNDIQRILGVSSEWLAGFHDGFTGVAARGGPGKDYQEGFSVGRWVIEKLVLGKW